jgi:hypothetical protein
MIVRLSGGTADMMEILARAIAWAERDKTLTLAHALDQAL